MTQVSESFEGEFKSFEPKDVMRGPLTAWKDLFEVDRWDFARHCLIHAPTRERGRRRRTNPVLLTFTGLE